MIKIYVFIQIILVAVLCYFVWQFSHTVKVPDADIDVQLKHLNDANDNLWAATWLVSIASLVVVHIAIHKTRKLVLLLFPYVVFFIFMYIYFNNFEVIFHFKKQNGFWKGSFSLTGIFAIVQVIPVFICYGINYAVLKNAYKERVF